MSKRGILDTNLLVSDLLDPRLPDRAINQVVEAAISGAYILVAPKEHLDEVSNVIDAKACIRDRVAPHDRAEFFEALAAVAELPAIEIGPPRQVVRDPNDNYLLEAAFVLEIDQLVTGDKDLLALASEVEDFLILSPREFLELLND